MVLFATELGLRTPNSVILAPLVRLVTTKPLLVVVLEAMIPKRVAHAEMVELLTHVVLVHGQMVSVAMDLQLRTFKRALIVLLVIAHLTTLTHAELMVLCP